MNLEKLASKLDQAVLNAQGIEQISLQQAISLNDAYEVQKIGFALREERGEVLKGYKLGFTSKAKMVQMGVDDLIWGRLSDQMMIEDGGELSMQRYVHPRVEPEICFLLKKPLAGIVSLPEAMSAVEAIAPALEVIDSRYDDFKFSLEDVVADNCSSASYVIGPLQKPGLDISNLGMILRIDGKDSAFGSSAAILGHPARALVSAARCVAEAGLSLQPGQVLMAGSASEAIALKAGQSLQLQVDQLGFVSFSTTA